MQPSATRVAHRYLTAASAMDNLRSGFEAAALDIVTRLERGFQNLGYNTRNFYVTISNSGKLVIGGNLRDPSWEYQQKQLELADRSLDAPPKMAARVSKIIGVRVGVSPVRGKKGWWWFRAEADGLGIVGETD